MRGYRLANSTLIVGVFLEWCEDQCHRSDLTPSDSLMKATRSAMNREVELRIFLENPDTQPYTNYQEREIRLIP